MRAKVSSISKNDHSLKGLVVEADDILVDYRVGLQRNMNEVLGRYSTPPLE